MKFSRLQCDVAVVGGGPAGLVASLELSRAGADVVLVDEGEELGGQYFKRRLGAVLEHYGDYRSDGTRLIEKVHTSSVRCLSGRLVWGVDDDDRTLLTAGTLSGDRVDVESRACIVATGAHERSLPFLGWQLPQVVTPGHALHLATCDRVAVGQQVLIAGTGPLLLVAAAAVLEAGGGVTALVELNAPYRLSLAGLSAMRYPSRLRELAGYAATLARHRVRLYQGWRVVSASGRERVEKATIELVRAGTKVKSKTFEVDGVAVAFGFRPATELLRLFGVRSTVDELGDSFPLVDDYGRTSVPRIYAAGEVVQIAGVRAAMSCGLLAAAAAAEDLGLRRLPANRVRAAEFSLRRSNYFARLISDLYPVTAATCRAVPDSAIVCRCEGVTAGELRNCASLGWNDNSATKAMTRAGMGPCQSRQCATAVFALVTEASGRMSSPFTVNMPIKPVPWTAVAGDTVD